MLKDYSALPPFFSRLAFLIAVLLFLATSSAVGRLLMHNPDITGVSNNISFAGYVLWAIIYGGFFTLIFFMPQVLLSLWRDGLVRFIIFIALLCLISTFWSIDRMRTLECSCLLIVMSLLSLFLAEIIPFNQWPRVWIVWSSVLVGSVFFSIIIDPSHALHDYTSAVHVNSLRGFFIQKNQLGRAAAITTVVMLPVAIDAGRQGRKNVRLICQFLIAAFIGFIFWAHSGTALIALAGACAITWISCYLVSMGVVALPFVLLGLIGFAVMTYTDFYSWIFTHMLTMLDKDPTMTDRIPIWHTIWHLWMNEHPWLGFGYNAFWLSPRGAPSVMWPTGGGWVPPHAHNGLLQTALDLGIAGVVCLVVLWLWLLKLCLRLLYTREPSVYYSLPFSMFIFATLENMTEIGFLRYIDITWMFLLIVVFYVKREAANRLAAPSTEVPVSSPHPGAGAPYSPGVSA